MLINQSFFSVLPMYMGMILTCSEISQSETCAPHMYGDELIESV